MALAFRVFLKNHDVCPMKYDNIIRIYPHPKNFIDLNLTFQYAIIFLLKGCLKILTNHVRFFQKEEAIRYKLIVILFLKSNRLQCNDGLYLK